MILPRLLRPARPRPRMAVLSLVAAALIAAGCGSSQSAHGATTTLVPASTVPPPTSAPATSSPGSTTSVAAATKVTATETEFHIMLSQQTFTPGTYTFNAVNAGTTIHNLAITGPGVAVVTKALSPGQTANLTVKLQRGTYAVFCAIDDHRALGMNDNITVS